MTLIPLSPETHFRHRWRRQAGWAFARSRALWPVTAMELPRLCTAFPIGWIDADDTLSPVAVLGLNPDHNLHVARDGKWLPRVMPLALQCAPFVTARSEKGEPVLCLDDQAGDLTQADDAEPLFTDNGELAEPVQKIAQTLQQQHANQANTQKATDTLHAHGLIKPWEAVVDTRAQGRVQLQGLYGIDEATLNQLSGDALKALSDSGALAMAYCQLVSMQHLAHLGRLADAHANLDEKYARQDSPEVFDFEAFF